MKMIEVKEKAKSLGINAGKMRKTELIHTIQRTEGNTDCFGRSNGQCPYTNCCFREDCIIVES
jgi:hypothetical protein